MRFCGINHAIVGLVKCDMLKRTLTGAVLVAIVVGFFLLRNVNSALFLILLGAVCIVGNFEMNKMLGDKTCNAQKIISLLFAVSLAPCVNFFGGTGALVSFAIFAIAEFFVPVFKKGNLSIESLALGFLSLIYPALVLVPMMLINALGEVSLFALVLIFAVSCCADVFAYLVGMALKGPKLCPQISPKKTVSGAIGGLLGGVIGAIVCFAFLKHTFNYHLTTSPYLYFAIVGLIGALLTELGDLVESFIKRSLNVKDSGKIFPGHGGMLDRFDGIMFCSVFIWMVTALF